MTRPNPKLSTGLSLLAAAVCLAGPPTATPRAGEPLPSVDAADLAQGRFSSMRMILQKTFLRINVATIDVRVDKRAQGRFQALARDQGYSDALAGQLADAAMGTERAVV